jgi:hypothetical protein
MWEREQRQRSGKMEEVRGLNLPALSFLFSHFLFSNSGSHFSLLFPHSFFLTAPHSFFLCAAAGTIPIA